VRTLASRPAPAAAWAASLAFEQVTTCCRVLTCELTLTSDMATASPAVISSSTAGRRSDQVGTLAEAAGVVLPWRRARKNGSRIRSKADRIAPPLKEVSGTEHNPCQESGGCVELRCHIGSG